MSRSRPYEEERQVAIEAVLKASELCRRVQEDLVSEATLTKEDRSPVTVADFGSQAVIGLELRRAFPHDPIMGEETADPLLGDGVAPLRRQVVEAVATVLPGTDEGRILEVLGVCDDAGGKRGRRWIVDPIDGTRGFLRRQQYAVALALMENGEVVLGVLGCPNLRGDFGPGHDGDGCLVVAVRGQGSFVRPLAQAPETELREAPIRVSEIADPTEACFCESVESGHSPHERHAEIAALLGVRRPPVRMDSQCKYAALARGRADIYLRLPTSRTYEEKIWDHAAGWIVVHEAGGTVTDAYGEQLDFSCGRTLARNRGVVSTNGRLHELVEAAVTRVLGST